MNAGPIGRKKFTRENEWRGGGFTRRGRQVRPSVRWSFKPRCQPRRRRPPGDSLTDWGQGDRRFSFYNSKKSPRMIHPSFAIAVGISVRLSEKFLLSTSSFLPHPSFPERDHSHVRLRPNAAAKIGDSSRGPRRRRRRPSNPTPTALG